MKESGKLIELLNEYENEETEANIRYWNYYQNGFHLLEYGETYSEMLIISKKYEFIKWLVENDKIDFDNRDLKDRFMNEFERYPQFQNNTTNREFNINGLLMLLAIQDESINFLISILKD